MIASFSSFVSLSYAETMTPDGSPMRATSLQTRRGKRNGAYEGSSARHIRPRSFPFVSLLDGEGWTHDRVFSFVFCMTAALV